MRFNTVSAQQTTIKLIEMEKYFNKHKDFFQSRGYNTFDHEKLLPYHLPVAQLVETMPQEQLLKQIQQQQYINKVYFK